MNRQTLSGFMVWCVPLCVVAQSEPSENVLNLQDMEVASALLLVAERAQQNIIVADDVTGKITVRLTDVSPKQALQSIIASQGLKSEHKGDILIVRRGVEPTSQAPTNPKATSSPPLPPPLVTRYFQLKHARAVDIAQFLRGAQEASTKSIGAINLWTVPASETGTLNRRNDLNRSPSDSLLSERGHVNFDERTNTIVVIDEARRMKDLAEIIRRLDVRTRQVMIESRVVVTSTAFAKSLGTRFRALAGRKRAPEQHDYGFGPFALGQPDNLSGSGIGMASQLGIPNPMGMVDLVLSKSSSYLLGLELTAMQREGQGEILSHPRIMTTDRYPASIRVGTALPYQEATGQGNTTTVFKEAVLKLEVTPYIAPSNQVTLDLQITKDEPNLALKLNGELPINTRAINTRVTVGDGETIVLGGVFEHESGTSREQIPGLGSVPGLRKIFGRDGRSNQQSELLVFVTPRIVEPPPEPASSPSPKHKRKRLKRKR